MSILYIDFEGDTEGELYMVGILSNGVFEQIILTEKLKGLAKARDLRIITFKDFLKEIKNFKKIAAYSLHEYDVLSEAGWDGFEVGSCNYINLASAAKRWIRRKRKDEFDSLPPFRKNLNQYQASRIRNSLASRMRLTDYKPPSDYAPFKTTARFKSGMDALDKNNHDYTKLTPTQKSKLTKALKHNEFDVKALQVLHEIIIKEYPSAID